MISSDRQAGYPSSFRAPLRVAEDNHSGEIRTVSFRAPLLYKTTAKAFHNFRNLSESLIFFRFLALLFEKE